MSLTIDPASVDTGNARRDEHLRSNTFFAVEEHPRLWYAASSARLEGVRLSADGEVPWRGLTVARSECGSPRSGRRSGWSPWN